MGAASPANSEDLWGCEVLMCLSNPNGATALKECEPPIHRLWRALNKRNPDPFPSCDQAKGGSNKAWAEPAQSWYDPCPAGTTALPSGSAAIRANEVDVQSGYAVARPGASVMAGIGDGSNAQPSSEEPLRPKVCVGKQLGVAMVTTGAGDSMLTSEVPCYDQIALLDAATSPKVINVYTDNQLTRVVRYGAADTDTAEAVTPADDEVPVVADKGRTAIFALAVPDLGIVEAGQDTVLRMRFEAVRGQFTEQSKVFAHFGDPHGTGLMNHWLWLPTQRSDFSGRREYSYFMNVPAEMAPGSYTVYAGIAGGKPNADPALNYALRMQYIDCVGVARFHPANTNPNGALDTCAVGRITITARRNASSPSWTSNGQGSAYVPMGLESGGGGTGMFYAPAQPW